MIAKWAIKSRENGLILLRVAGSCWRKTHNRSVRDYRNKGWKSIDPFWGGAKAKDACNRAILTCPNFPVSLWPIFAWGRFSRNPYFQVFAPAGGWGGLSFKLPILPTQPAYLYPQVLLPMPMIVGDLDVGFASVSSQIHPRSLDSSDQRPDDLPDQDS